MSGRKPRSDSRLKSLLTEEQREMVAAWAQAPKGAGCAGGLAHAVERLRAECGVKTSLSAVSEFLGWWRLQRRFGQASARALQVQELLKERDPGFSPEEIARLGEALFNVEAMEAEDARTYIALQQLRLDRESAESRATIEREKLALSRRRLQLATCEKFLEWNADGRAREIAAGSGTKAEKIEALGRAMFGEDWEDRQGPAEK